MSDQQQLFRHGALTAWYEAAKPALFTNKVIREWLSAYTESQRPDAVKIVLVHGILCLRKSFGAKPLTLQELANVTEQGYHAVTLTDGLPAVKEEMTELQQALDSFSKLMATAEPVEP